MTRIIHPERDSLDEAARIYLEAEYPVALTGAGISVESGIPDFRSDGGLWSVFRPEEYATIEVFTRNPGKAWRLYRALGATLIGKQPSPAHAALARLESADALQAIITQNIDGLHSRAGSGKVLEAHGEHQNLHCLACGFIRPFEPTDLEDGPPPACSQCGYPLKPNIVLFGEMVRQMPEIDENLARCDLLLVIGTSAQVYPVASFPYVVHRRGGLIYEFNMAATPLTASADYFFQGKAGASVPALANTVLGGLRGTRTA
ncbi:MAG: NAD-dependent deacetylase [Acidobacteriota bacterium]